MDLVNAAVNLQAAKVTSELQYRVARKMLDIQKDQGNVAVSLIEAAGKGVAQAGDALVAAATGLGGSIDTYA